MLTCLKAAKCDAARPFLTHIKGNCAGAPRVRPVEARRARAMFGSSELGDELQALESEVLRLLKPDGENLFDAAKNRADALGDQIKAALTELGETLSEEEGHVEQLIAERPITTMASAFALGVVIGFMLRRP
jgi:ElaB/YqjD/DUF883 family membrane-anchored ribosome-binding protein